MTRKGLYVRLVLSALALVGVCWAGSGVCLVLNTSDDLGVTLGFLALVALALAAWITIEAIWRNR